MSTPVETSTRARLLLVAGGVLGALAVVEFVLFPLLLPFTPLRLHVFLPEGVRVLAQSSKESREPERYVAIAGDSYAQGRGDWLLGQDPDRNGPFQSAHVIHARTGIDVLSVARGGTGAVRGTVEARAELRYLEQAPRIGLPPPEVLFFYFYEGNDLVDTLLELLYLYGSGPPEPGTDDAVAFQVLLSRALEDAPDYFRRALDDPAFGDAADFRERVEGLLARHPLVRRAEHPGPGDWLPAMRTLWRIGRAKLTGRPPGSPEEDVFPLRRQRPQSLRPINVVRVRGQEVPLTVELQGPGPDLSDRETDAALWALEQSLALLRDGLPGTRVCVVYIPSPAATYESARPTIVIQPLGRREDEYPAEVVRARSDALRARVGTIARRLGLDFVDTTEPVRRNARVNILHGPTDVRHFNELGYTLLGNVVARYLAESPPG